MTPEEIKDRETLERWLNARPHEDSVWIATRSALRVLPLWFAYRASSRVKARAQNVDVTSFPLLRSNLTAGAALFFDSPEVRDAAFDAAHSMALNYADIDADDFTADVARIAADGARISALVASNPDLAGVRSSRVAASTASTDATAWKPVLADCRALASGTDLATLPLWHSTSNPFQSQWEETRTLWKTPGSPFAFWLGWYQSALDGHPLDPKLLHDIALIPDEDWQKGETHIAGLIEIIEERHRLLQQIADLKEQLRAAHATSTMVPATELQRSHNHPPELVDAPAVVRQQTIIIRAGLDEAEAELKKPDPEPATLRKIGYALLEASKALVLYCASLGDIVLKKAAEEIGSTGTRWALRVGAACLLGQSIGQARIDLAGKIVAGG